MRKIFILLFFILIMLSLFLSYSPEGHVEREIIKDEVIKSVQPIFPQVENIILITVDNLRADHTGYMGYHRDTSPFLDKIVKKSIIFRNAHTAIPITSPADASIFTSLYPLQHKSSNNYEKLDDSFLTMAEILQQNNFKTAAFVGVKHLLWNNLDQDFEVFNIPEEKMYRSADKTIGLATEWLEKEKEDNFFCGFIYMTLICHIPDIHP